MAKRTRGFTIIELLFVIILLGIATMIGWSQFNTLETLHRDDMRRTSINALYYNLEEVYHAKHEAYPQTITSSNVPAMDPDLLTDPNGVKIGDSESDFVYEPVNCQGTSCKGYTLRAHLENEADYVKENR